MQRRWRLALGNDDPINDATTPHDHRAELRRDYVPVAIAYRTTCMAIRVGCRNRVDVECQRISLE